ncbi:MAG TPA: alpha-hydroxy acid oxidase [Candidatus Eisenbacteria bacterium]|nr:alpha-hydroxy acid oxidase [Candidatus Eisenbacteria bacterium]
MVMKKRRPAKRSTTRRRDPIDRCINIADFEAMARPRMAPGAFDYFVGGAEEERTLGLNREGFDRYVFLPRVLVDVSQVRLSTTVLGTEVSSPILLAPTAYQKLAHREGELATARAAGKAGTLMCASTMANHSLEAIAAAASGPLWFQLYAHPERALTERLVKRAEQAGYRALALTVDTPRLGRRERDLRSDYRPPRNLELANFAAEGIEIGWEHLPGRSRLAPHLLDASVTWKTIEWLKSLTTMPVVLKGVMRPDDARRAVDAGAAAIWVSNHGGRQLDGAQATILALPAVVEAVDGAVEVYVDGGIRRGTDVLKALALGARAVFIGRPYLWGLVAGGEGGVTRVLELLKDELELAMMLAGVDDARKVDPTLVIRS